MVSIKEIAKLLSVFLLTVCAVFVCSIFINFYFDLKDIAALITDSSDRAIYDAQLTMSITIVACTGGVLGAVTFIVLLFSISRFISDNSANIGVLKALGYSENRLALGFSKFGFSVLIGTILGYLLGFLCSPLFYNSLIGDTNIQFSFGFHIETIVCVIFAPSLLFTLLAVLYAKIALRKKPLELITGYQKMKVNQFTKTIQKKESDKPFLKELQTSMLTNNLLIIFFVGFAGFAFSAQIQMAFSMRELTPDDTMTITLLIVGFLLGAVTLLLAFTFLFHANCKYLALMKGYGYHERECTKAIFGGYRIVVYIGFLIGTGYQFLLVKAVANLFAGTYDIPDITFNFIGFFVTIVIFILIYELLMVLYKKRIFHLHLKVMMQDVS